MTQFEQGSVTYVFFWAGSPEQPQAPVGCIQTDLAFGSAVQAAMFLRRFARLGDLRELLRKRIGLDAGRWDNEALIRRVTQEMAQRRLVVRRFWPPGEGPSAGQGEAPSAVPRTSRTEVQETGEAPSFLQNHDGAAQAAALLKAAEKGAVLVEECTR